MRRYAIGLLLATGLCWNICQGEIKFYSDDVTCSQNGTTKLASRQKTLSVIFCVQVGSTDVLNTFVYITHSSQSPESSSWYWLKRKDRTLQVSSVTSSSYTTVNITFTKLEPGDFNKTFFVSIYQEVGSNNSDIEKVQVWFILKEEAEDSGSSSTSEEPAATRNTEDVISTVAATNSETTGDVNRFLAIGVTAVIILILCTTTGSLIYCYRRRSFQRSRQRMSVTKDGEELLGQNKVPLPPTVSNTAGQPADSDHGNNLRDQPTCPVELNSPYTHYEEIRNIETCSRESSSVLTNRPFSDIQREEVEYEIPVQVMNRDVTSDCYVELMDDLPGVSATSFSSPGKGFSQFSKVVEYLMSVTRNKEELLGQNKVPLPPTVSNTPGQPADSDHRNNLRDQPTCPVELNSPYTHYEEIRNVESCSLESSNFHVSTAFSDIQREEVEYEIPVQVMTRDNTPDCYVDLMDDPYGVPEKPSDSTPDCYVELMDDPPGVPEKPRDSTPDCYVELMDDPSGVPEKPRDSTPDCYVELMDDPPGVPEKLRDSTPDCYVELMDDPPGVPEKPRDSTPDCYVELMDDPPGVPEKLRDSTPDCYVELMDDPSGVPEKLRDSTPDCYVELMDDPPGVPATSVSSAQFSTVVE